MSNIGDEVFPPEGRDRHLFSSGVIFNGLGRLLCMGKYHEDETLDSIKHVTYNHNSYTSIDHKVKNNSCIDLSYLNSKPPHTCMCNTQYTASGGNGRQGDFLRDLQQQVRNMHDLVESLARRQTKAQKAERETKAIEEEWRHLASIMDRVFSFVYLVAIILALVTLFPRP